MAHELAHMYLPSITIFTNSVPDHIHAVCRKDIIASSSVVQNAARILAVEEVDDRVPFRYYYGPQFCSSTTISCFFFSFSVLAQPFSDFLSLYLLHFFMFCTLLYVLLALIYVIPY